MVNQENKQVNKKLLKQSLTMSLLLNNQKSPLAYPPSYTLLLV